MDVRDYKIEFKRCLTRSAQGILDAARVIGKADDGLSPKQIRTLREQLGLTAPTYSKWQRIARCERLRQVVEKLPPSFTTIYTIATLTDPEFEKLLASGILSQNLPRAGLEDWITRLRASGSALDEILEGADPGEAEDGLREEISRSDDRREDDDRRKRGDTSDDADSVEHESPKVDAVEAAGQPDPAPAPRAGAPHASEPKSETEGVKAAARPARRASANESRRGPAAKDADGAQEGEGREERGAPSREYAATTAGDTKRRAQPSPSSEPRPRLTLHLTLLLDRAFSPEELAKLEEHLLAFPGVRGIRPDDEQRLAA